MQHAVTACAITATIALGGAANAQDAGLIRVSSPQTDLGFGVDALPATDVSGPALSSQGRITRETTDWTGFYIGGQLGVAFGDADLADDDENVIGGVTLGYDHDFGRWVLGAALDYDFTDLDVAPGTDLEEVVRLKIRGGPKIGKGLVYGAAGWANADTNDMGNDDGWFIGGGYEYMLTDRVSVGADVLYHEFDSFNGTNNDIDFTTLQVRATFRF